MTMIQSIQQGAWFLCGFVISSLAMAQTPNPDQALPTSSPDVKKSPVRSTGISPVADLPRDLFSPQAAMAFAKCAYELYRASDATDADVLQAKVFLYAALVLDPRATYVMADLIRVLTGIPDRDFGGEIQWALHAYADDPALDMEIANRAAQYLHDRLQDRPRREQQYTKLLEIASTRNRMFSAEIARRIGLLMAEKPDFEGAEKTLLFAYANNPYSSEIFSTIQSIMAKQNMALRSEVVLQFMRRSIQADPVDVQTAVNFAALAQRIGVVDHAAAGFDYAAAAYRYWNPQTPLPAELNRTLALAHYNDPNTRNQCLVVAEDVRKSGELDLLVEAYAGRAAEKLGRSNQAREILSVAAARAEKALAEDPATAPAGPELMAWFYAFADPSPEKALAWANRARGTSPQSETVKALFGYVLAMNSQPDLTAEFAKDLSDRIPVAAMAMALVKLSEGEKDSAINLFKNAIRMDGSTLVADHARQWLKEQGSEFVSPEDVEKCRNAIQLEFHESALPVFSPASKRLVAEFKLRGSDLSYGRPIEMNLIIRNPSSEPLIISEDGILKGRYRIDAVVRGDLSVEIPRLIERRIQPSRLIMGPSKEYPDGRFMAIPLDVDTGRLHPILWGHPQASLDIELIAYLDPVSDDAGHVRNSLPDIPPVRIRFKRPGIKLTRDFLMQRLESVARGQSSQKILAAEVCTGLLYEQMDRDRSGAQYRFIQVAPDVYYDAIRRCLMDDDWKVVFQTLMALNLISSPIPFELTQAVSPLLQNTNWPVRMMALKILSRSSGQSFQQVLDWSASSDEHLLVRDLAVSLGGKVTEKAPILPLSDPAILPPSSDVTISAPGTDTSKPIQ